MVIIIKTIQLFVLLVASYFLFEGGLSTETSRSVKALWDLGHVAYFVLLTLSIIKTPWINNKLFENKSFKYISTITLLSTLFIGVIIEFLQYGTSRSASINDVANDLLGTFLVLTFYKPISVKLLSVKQIGLKIIALCLCAISLTPLSRAMIDEYYSSVNFPVLSDFTSYFEIDRWTGKAKFYIDNDKSINKAFLNVEFGTQLYSNISLKYFENDWQGYATFNVKIINPNKYPVDLVLRIHDIKHKPKYEYADRFNKNLSLKPGFNEIKIAIKDIQKSPKNRLIDLKRIEGISFFTIKLKKPEKLYVQSLYLSE